MPRMIPLYLAVLLAGCAPKRDEASALAAENYRRQYQDEAERARAAEAKVAELEAALAEARKLEEALAAAEARSAELEQRVDELTALNATLAQDTQKLAQAKEALEKRSSEYEALATSLKDEIRSGKIELSELRGRMVVKMKDKILFSSGSVKINAEGLAALAKVAEALKDVQGKVIRVEGHTDNVPTDPKGPFPTNWELSTTRALAVVHLLQEKGVPANKLSAVGYGEHYPVASNATASGKSLNRRIEIVLAPEEQAPKAKARAAKR